MTSPAAIHFAQLGPAVLTSCGTAIGAPLNTRRSSTRGLPWLASETMITTTAADPARLGSTIPPQHPYLRG